MKRFAVAVLGVAAVSAAAAGDDYRTLTSRGLGPVMIGMTIEQAARAMGQKLNENYEATDGDQTCGSASSKESERRGFGFLVENRIITRIEIGNPSVNSSYPAIVTADGIGIGASEAAVKRAYGQRLKIEPHPYDENGHYLIVDDVDHTRGIIFETDGKRVTNFRSGVYPALGYIEGCL